jgi:hypothetical protein
MDMTFTKLAFLLVLSLFGQSHSGERRVPIERMVAGYSIENSGQVAVRDKRSGCYLIRTGD